MTALIWSTLRTLRLNPLRYGGTLTLLIAFCALDPSKALTKDSFWADPATGLAIGGFDPVSFFTQRHPLPGSDEYEYVWNGVSWRFDNEGNMAAFVRDPEVYAPQFGGHGSLALARGHKAAGNPRLWVVSNGKLYLFYSQANRSEWVAMSEADRDVAKDVWSKWGN